jgi:hypothetical protein
MVHNSSLSTNWSVVVTTYVLSGREPGSSVIASIHDTSAFDAFDFAINAQGYFRHAIQDMGVSSLTIDVIEGSRAVESIEITRD